MVRVTLVIVMALFVGIPQCLADELPQDVARLIGADADVTTDGEAGSVGEAVSPSDLNLPSNYKQRQQEILSRLMLLSEDYEASDIKDAMQTLRAYLKKADSSNGACLPDTQSDKVLLVKEHSLATANMPTVISAVEIVDQEKEQGPVHVGPTEEPPAPTLPTNAEASAEDRQEVVLWLQDLARRVREKSVELSR